jgi:hypothetical protein
LWDRWLDAKIHILAVHAADPVRSAINDEAPAMDRFRWDPLPDPGAGDIPAHVVSTMPAALARSENVMPLAMNDGVLTVAVESLSDVDLIEKLEFILGTCGRGIEIEPVAAPAEVIRAAVARYYGEAGA